MSETTAEEEERRHRLDNLIAAVNMLAERVARVHAEQVKVRRDLDAVVERLDREGR